MKLDDMDKCIFTGKAIKHYTEFKPDCFSCTGYREKCEKEGLYEPKWQIRNNLPPKN